MGCHIHELFKHVQLDRHTSAKWKPRTAESSNNKHYDDDDDDNTTITAFVLWWMKYLLSMKILSFFSLRWLFSQERQRRARVEKRNAIHANDCVMWKLDQCFELLLVANYVSSIQFMSRVCIIASEHCVSAKLSSLVLRSVVSFFE